MNLNKSLFILALFFTCIFSQKYLYKHPQGSPSEFDSFVNPTPEETAITVIK